MGSRDLCLDFINQGASAITMISSASLSLMASSSAQSTNPFPLRSNVNTIEAA